MELSHAVKFERNHSVEKRRIKRSFALRNLGNKKGGGFSAAIKILDQGYYFNGEEFWRVSD